MDRPSTTVVPPAARPAAAAPALPEERRAAERRSEDRRPVPGWRSRDILRAAALVLGFYFLLRLLWDAQAILLAAFLGVLFGLAVARGADWLERWRVPRGVGASLIVFGTYGLLAGFITLSAPTLQQQFGELRTSLPEATDQIERWLEAHRGGVLGQLLVGGAATAENPAARPAPPARPRAGKLTAAPGAVPQTVPKSGETVPGPEGGLPSTLRRTLTAQLGGLGRYMFRFVSSTVAVATGLLLITFIAIYIGADPRTYRRGLLHLVPHEARPRAREVLDAIGATLRRWLVSQLVAMLVIGVVTTLVLLALDVKAAVSLGILAGLLEFIPNIGPVLSALPAIVMGFLDSPQKAVLVALAYAGIQLAENHLLIPLLMRKGVDLPPVLTLLAQALMALVFGFLGLLVAVPLVAAVVVTVKMLYVEDVVGDEVEVFGQAQGQ